jgi:glucans biosynthesis protein C
MISGTTIRRVSCSRRPLRAMVRLSSVRATLSVSERDIAMSGVGLALDNLRGFVILMVLAFHSFTAYMASLPRSAPPFDAPRDWVAHPIIDSDRWLGFDLFGAFQFLHLMQLMFFLSGLFVWPSLMRKGAATFIRDRVLRLGVPFVAGVFLLMPVAYFPVYRVSAVDPSWSGFWSHWIALPFWPSGPIWFLWFILVLNVVAAGLYWRAPRAGELLGQLSAYAGNHPERFFITLVIVSAAVYWPLAALFEPWQWVELGPFAIQPSLAPQYAVYFLAGVAAGAHGIDRGPLRSDAMLARCWALWLVGAFAAFLLWLVPAALIVKGQDAALPGLHIARELGVVLFAASACFASAASFLRFATMPRRIFGGISENAYGIYLFHYVFVIWTQYALLNVAMHAFVKGAIVLSVTLALSWAASAGVSCIPAGARLLRGERRMSMAEARSSAKG